MASLGLGPARRRQAGRFADGVTLGIIHPVFLEEIECGKVLDALDHGGAPEALREVDYRSDNVLVLDIAQQVTAELDVDLQLAEPEPFEVARPRGSTAGPGRSTPANSLRPAALRGPATPTLPTGGAAVRRR